MKLSLHSVAYGGYFYDGPALALEDILHRAAAFGYDAVELFAHRPVAFPVDVSGDRKKVLADLLAQRKEEELLFLRECCRLARDLDCANVLIFAAWLGYFMPEHWQVGYGDTAMHSRSIEVSTEDDYLRQWEHAREAIREAGQIAADDPPLTNSLQDCIDMQIAADVCLLERQDDDYVNGAFRRVGDRLIHSHALGIRFRTSLVGEYGFEEVVPGEGRENWIDRRFRAGREYLAALLTQAGAFEGRAAAAGLGG